MKKTSFLIADLIFFIISISSQPVNTRLKTAFQQFENDAQLRNAISALYVINAKTGEVVFSKNAFIGLSPASTQKIITSITAYELLGKNYTYITQFGFNSNKNLLYIKPSGDPTFGSWRWNFTKEDQVLKRISLAMQQQKITDYGVVVDDAGWEAETIPGGWTWQDIGNYYGAGTGAFNWRENQVDILLKSGKNIGEAVTVVKTIPKLYDYSFTSLLTSAAKGTGDNAYVYFQLNSNKGVIRGTIPVNESRFSISGTMPFPLQQFTAALSESLNKATGNSSVTYSREAGIKEDDYKIFHTEISPPLDSVIYWFNKKSINLYGEALTKTFAYEKKITASTENGVAIMKDFCKQKGINENELNIYDGSGLSLSNRVTAHVQVELLKYAKKQAWFSSFYYALPEYNGMKMKSGTVNAVKGFAGYHTSKAGVEYIFSFLVNNYNGGENALVQKMYKVLDVLK